MSDTKCLARAELELRVLRETIHARKALVLLGRSKPSDRIRRSSSGGPERLDSYAMRSFKRHMRAVTKARAMLARLQ